MSKAISVRECILATLRFLATGDSYNNLQCVFRIPPCTIGRIATEVTKTILDCHRECYLKIRKDTVSLI
ncbi:hypothetical protein PR048_005233 [Dryococelus australis]|uniref:Uncharacterized protein n=1 Tax=Dryococelus australis TaxID=614101 RepID=A0ABQ9I7M1_9NEOP|nr:hypothetical protein PR048_005233 [Dryococelus australis]